MYWSANEHEEDCMRTLNCENFESSDKENVCAHIHFHAK